MGRFNTFRVQFQFIGFKTLKYLNEEEFNWPNQMAFRFQFFHFETIQTHLAQLKKPVLIGNQAIFNDASRLEPN